MQKTKIPWATHTWNPIRGCFPVSEGCANCYAARLASRFAGPGKPFEGLAKGGKWTGKIRFIENEHWDEYRHPNNPTWSVDERLRRAKRLRFVRCPVCGKHAVWDGGWMCAPCGWTEKK